MRAPTLEELRRRPELWDDLVRRAHAQRAEAMTRMFKRTVAALRARLEWALLPRSAHVQGRPAQR
jgi:hypothetical protein